MPSASSLSFFAWLCTHCESGAVIPRDTIPTVSHVPHAEDVQRLAVAAHAKASPSCRGNAHAYCVGVDAGVEERSVKGWVTPHPSIVDWHEPKTGNFPDEERARVEQQRAALEAEVDLPGVESLRYIEGDLPSD